MLDARFCERKLNQIINKYQTTAFEISNRGTLISLAAFVDPIHVNNEKEKVTKHTLAEVQRPLETALIACHLPQHRPPVGRRMTQW